MVEGVTTKLVLLSWMMFELVEAMLIQAGGDYSITFLTNLTHGEIVL